MEIDFETWKQLVEGAKVITAKLVQPNSLYIEFDTGMACYVAADTPLEFDFNWLEGFEFVAKPALKIYMESMRKREKTLERKCKNCQFCIPTKRGPFICGLGANEFVDIYVDDKGEEHWVARAPRAREIVQPEPSHETQMGSGG